MSVDHRVWITRARPGADRTAERVAALGWSPVVQPLLAVEPLAPAIDLTDVAALAFTSLNGVAAFAARQTRRDLPVFTVGDATADAARAAGFADVVSASGDVADLAALIASRPPAGPLLWAGAETPAGDLIGDLTARGVQARAAHVYRTRPCDVGAALAAASGAGIVLLHSPRAAALLAGRLDEAGPRLALCLSAAVARALAPPPGLEIRIAAHPDEAHMLALLGNPARAV